MLKGEPPSRYKLTYKATKDADATHEWKRIQTVERAIVIAKQARKPIPARPAVSALTKQNAGGEKHHH